MAAAKTALLEGFYGRIADSPMRGMPMLNPALGVEAVGMQPWQDEWLCVLITPWFMNLVLLPGEVAAIVVQVGTKSRVALPGGVIEFIQSEGEHIGPHRMCSLFSPVFEFKSMDDAVLTAQAVLEQLLEQPEAESDDGMLAIWEGRMEEAEAKAVADQLQSRNEGKESVAEPKLSRRALFGLSSKEGGSETAP
jgi:[NiFe] hydrogenase assembly HybE family chaperone